MNFLRGDWILTCDENLTIIQDGAIVFGDEIIDIDTLQNLEKKYPNEVFLYQGDNSVIMPGLINSHVHLEFSGNKTTLQYGNFVKWLFSVIANREELIEKATKELIDNELQIMISNGTTTIGAVSSYGFDINSCIETKLNVVYFTEILGSKPEMIDTLLQDFKEKFNLAKKYKSSRFIPAVAIHSPYSTHPFLVREALRLAKEEDTPVSAHFMESVAENDWLNYSTGEFATFFKEMLGQQKSLQKPNEFLSVFKGINNLSFTHCVRANKEELTQIKELGASIIHCPNSNRLLENTALNLDYLDDISLALGTDGLSSNYTLDLFEEMRNAFFIHKNFIVRELADKLLMSSTKGGANALGFHNKGSLETNKDADLIVFNLPDIVQIENLTTAIILHKSKIKKTYIKGHNALN
ncbi:MAG: metal-dependent hydrolase [Arcobacter sp.]|nr:metal-dependent hydrolase [Arcobacter sp.]